MKRSSFILIFLIFINKSYCETKQSYINCLKTIVKDYLYPHEIFYNKKTSNVKLTKPLTTDLNANLLEQGYEILEDIPKLSKRQQVALYNDFEAMGIGIVYVDYKDNVYKVKKHIFGGERRSFFDPGKFENNIKIEKGSVLPDSIQSLIKSRVLKLNRKFPETEGYFIDRIELRLKYELRSSVHFHYDIGDPDQVFYIESISTDGEEFIMPIGTIIQGQLGNFFSLGNQQGALILSKNTKASNEKHNIYKLSRSTLHGTSEKDSNNSKRIFMRISIKKRKNVEDEELL